MNKRLENIIHKKQNSITKSIGYPSNAEGRNGDFSVRTVPGRGIFLMYKMHSKWYGTRLSRFRPVAEEGHEPIKLPTGVSPKHVGEMTLKGGKINFKKTSGAVVTVRDEATMFSLADDTVLGNISGATAVATGITASQLRTLANVENGATADQTRADIDGLAITTTGALNSGSITSGFGNINNGSSTIDTTGAVSTGALTCTTIDTGQGANEVYDMDQNVKTDSSVGFAEITSGAVVWAEFPFNVQNAIHNRYYFRDVDDLDDFRKWDSNDTDPTGFNYRNVAGSYTVPENCTLKAMSGVVANPGATQNPTIHVFTGSVTEGTGDTTLSSAGSVAVSIGTSYVPTKFSDTYDVDLSAGDIVVPMVQSVNLGATPDFYGSLTLKFITR